MPAKGTRKGSQLRSLEAHVLQLDVAGEMVGLLQRVRGNKSKRTTSSLVKTGPLRVDVIGLDEGGEVADHNVGGPFTIQCLLGRVKLSIEGSDQRLSTGDLLVVDGAIAHSITAEEPSVLLVIAAPGQ